MEARDVILGHILVERGWLGPEELEACRRECAASGSFSDVVVRRRAIPKEELDALWADITKVLEHGVDPAHDEQEDLLLGQYLQSTHQISADHLKEVEAARRSLGKADIVPRLAELLLEKGFVTLSALEEALHAGKALSTPVTCRSCGAGFRVIKYDAGRVYLCRKCKGELRPAADARGMPPLEAGPRGEFGHYGQATEIGRGGMGVVYKAWDEAHKRWVALKVIHDNGSIEELGRFRREVEIARALHHPNIVKLHEVTQVGSRHLIAMEYIDGETLGGERLGPQRAAELLAAIARAVQYAHSRGIVHRDIKPQNIMVDRGGKPYLMDFGLAKSLDTRSSITSVGTVMGTPSFMAPEQAIGRSSRIDRRTDIYSLGAVLYHLVTGRPPFRGATPMDTIRKVVEEPLVPPSEIIPDLPGRLDRVLLKCMDKDKNRRYQTAQHLAEELDRYA